MSGTPARQPVLAKPAMLPGQRLSHNERLASTETVRKVRTAAAMTVMEFPEACILKELECTARDLRHYREHFPNLWARGIAVATITCAQQVGMKAASTIGNQIARLETECRKRQEERDKLRDSGEEARMTSADVNIEKALTQAVKAGHIFTALILTRAVVLADEDDEPDVEEDEAKIRKRYQRVAENLEAHGMPVPKEILKMAGLEK